jgi:cytochrome c553
MSCWREDVLVAMARVRFSIAPIVRHRRDRALMRRGVMFKSRLASVFFAIAAVVTFPAYGADDIASRAQVCTGCHGQDGKPATPVTPIIWGQQGSYLYKELHDYHSGARSNETMSSIAQSFSLADLRSIADYFAAETWPTAAAKAAKAAATPAPQGIAMCTACHGQNFEGGAPAPRLAGLDYTYLVNAMNGFADKTRTNNLDMPGFMRALTKSQREAMARYLSAL